MSNVCLREEVEIDWWIGEGEEEIGEGGGGVVKKAREVDRWTDRGWERRILKTLCRLSRTRRTTGAKQKQEITVNPFFLYPFLPAFFGGIFISPDSPLYPTHTHAITHTHSENCRRCWTFSPGSSSERGQSGIYAPQFIFVLEAPRGLSSMLAWGNYTYTPAISPPITAH